MRIFKGNDFAKWAKKNKISDESLVIAVDEISKGLIDANLGGGVLKKRVSIANRGKRGGARTILAFRLEGISIFMYGYAKNEKSNLTSHEEKALKTLAKIYLSLSNKELDVVVSKGELVEIKTKGEQNG